MNLRRNKLQDSEQTLSVLITGPSTCIRACELHQFPHSLKTAKLKAHQIQIRRKLYLKASAIVGTLPSKDPQAWQCQREKRHLQGGGTGEFKGETGQADGGWTGDLRREEYFLLWPASSHLTGAGGGRAVLHFSVC